MFRSDRVCAVMFSQQGGPGRNLNEYLLSKPPQLSYFANSDVNFLYFCAPAHFAGSFDQTLAAILASRAFGKKKFTKDTYITRSYASLNILTES